MRIRNLNSFIKVATLGSFHAAAVQLHTSQPAISARIATLEEELGVKLFQRDQSGTLLTTRGLQLLPYAERLVAINNEMKAQLQNKVPEDGIFRVGIADTLAQLWLQDLLKRWRQQHPLIQLELTIDLSHALHHKLINHKLDLVFMVDRSQEGIFAQPLCSYPQFWVASPEFIKEHKVHNLEDLAHLPILSFPSNTEPRRYLQKLFYRHNTKLKLNTSNSVAGLLAMATQGAGAVLLTEPFVTPLLQTGKLVRLNIHPKAPPLQFCSGWRQDEDRVLPQLMADSAHELIAIPSI